MIWVVVGVAIVAVGLGLLLVRRRRTTDGVASFQRQIDALSPQARRRVVDRVQQLDDVTGDVGSERDDERDRGVDGA